MQASVMPHPAPDTKMDRVVDAILIRGTPPRKDRGIASDPCGAVRDDTRSSSARRGKSRNTQVTRIAARPLIAADRGDVTLLSRWVFHSTACVVCAKEAKRPHHVRNQGSNRGAWTRRVCVPNKQLNTKWVEIRAPSGSLATPTQRHPVSCHRGSRF